MATLPPRFFWLQPKIDHPGVKRVRLDFLPPPIKTVPTQACVLSPPAVHDRAVKFLVPEIREIPIEPLLPPIISGRVRELSPGRARDKGQKTESSGESQAHPRPAPLIPPELWNELWRILSPPPRVEELVTQIKFPSEVRPYQVDGVKHLIQDERFILADEMGTGKTVQVCVALSLLIRLGRVKTALIVCPKTTLSVWYDHLSDWVPGAVLHTYEEVPRVISKSIDGRPRVWVVSYSRLARRQAAISWGRNWDLVVLDEVHELRNPATVRYNQLQRIISQARYRWGLSGTPLQNRLEELSAIFALIKPELKLQAEDMAPSEVREKIRPYLRRVRRQDVLTELPPKHRREIWLEMDEAQSRAYRAVLNRESTSFHGAERISFTHIWQVLIELKKICNFAPGASTSPKLRKLLQIIKSVLARGEKVVVFTQFRTVGLQPLIPHLKPFGVVVVHGECTDQERREAIRRFQNDPQYRVFLGTVQTSGHGLTLTAANHVVHFDHWWNPAVSWQAEDRVYRIGQTKPVTVYDLWMKETVEERIRRILEQKGLLHREVIERLSDSEFRRSFTLEELLAVLDLAPMPTSVKKWN